MVVLVSIMGDASFWDRMLDAENQDRELVKYRLFLGWHEIERGTDGNEGIVERRKLKAQESRAKRRRIQILEITEKNGNRIDHMFCASEPETAF